MLSEIAQQTTEKIAEELRRTFASPAAGGRPLPGSSPRVGAVEAWIDLRRRADSPTRRKIDDAIQQALTAALSDSTIDPETVCAHLRVLRLAFQEGPGFRKVNVDAKNAVLGAIQSERYKGLATSYGDTHAELLACVETLRLAPNYEFWFFQMSDTRYVSHAVSGCLGSGIEHWALSGVIQAAKLGDSSLALALMRLFRMLAGRESVAWGRFGEARRNGSWSQEVFDRVSSSLAQIGQSCPSDTALSLEKDVACLQEELRHMDRLWRMAEAQVHYLHAEEDVNHLRLEDSVRELGEAVRILEPCGEDPRASDACKQYREAADALRYLIDRRTTFAAAESDPHQQLNSLVNWSAPACRSGRYERVALYRLSCALSLREVIDVIMQDATPTDSARWHVASTAVGHLGLLAVCEEQRSNPDYRVLNVARREFEQIAASHVKGWPAKPRFFVFAVLSTLRLFQDVNVGDYPLALKDDIANYGNYLAGAANQQRVSPSEKVVRAWQAG